MVANDSEGLEIQKAACNCGDSHPYYPAQWVVPLVKNKWVPVGNDKRNRASAQSLATLLRGNGWEPSSLKENHVAVELLKALGVSHFELTREFIAEDDHSRAAVDNACIDILITAEGNVSHLNHAIKYIECLKDDEGLPVFLEKRRERRRIVHENQKLGQQVEHLVKASLEHEGFTVRRTGVGSDFEIEYVTRLELARSGETWLVEVKATRDDKVRMTDTQARTAVKKGGGFLLCVVPVDGETSDLELCDVRDNMRFVVNIGPRMDKLCNKLDQLKDLRDDITADESSDIQLEVDSGVARVLVASSVWRDDGFPIADISKQLE